MMPNCLQVERGLYSNFIGRKLWTEETISCCRSRRWHCSTSFQNLAGKMNTDDGHTLLGPMSAWDIAGTMKTTIPVNEIERLQNTPTCDTVGP